MRQAVMTSPGHIQINEIPEPGKLGDNEILMRIKKIGVCGSDVHVYHGEHPATPYPVVQGHEYSAVVEAVGSNVKDIKKGMYVTARPQLVCGKCRPCLQGNYNICNNLKVQGFQAPGVAQDLFAVDAAQVVAFPASMSFDEGALIEPSAVGAHATKKPGPLHGKNVVVSGAGTIGNLVAQFARLRGAKKVVITDVSDYRLDMAKKCGVEYTINVAKKQFEDEAARIFGDEGFQVGFEAAGVQASLDVLVERIEKGGTVVIIGVYAQNPVVNMYYLGEHELKMIGSLMYLHEDYQEAVDAIANARINVKPLITQRFPFEEYDDAYKFIERNKDTFLKVMIDL